MKLLLLVVLAGAAAMAETVTVDCGPVRLGFDGDTGQWTALRLAEGAPNLLGAGGANGVELDCPDAPWPALGQWRTEAPQVGRTGAGYEVRVARRAGDWSATSFYAVDDDRPRVRRRVTVRWEGEEPVKVYAASLRVPGVTLGGAPDAVWSLPGNYPFEERRIADSQAGRTTRERGWTWSDTGMAYARSEREWLALLTAYGLELDAANVRVEETDGGVTLVHRFHTVAALPPGAEIEVGTQWIEVATADRAGLRVAANGLAQAANPGPPEDRPAWLEGAVIEELHPWGRLEAWGAGDRGNRMPGIEAQLPYLRDLGVTAIWLLPVSEKPPWVYHLPRFRNIDPQVTTPEQLRSFIATGHELGLRTLMDLVTYGVAPESPDVTSLPEHVWCRNEEGERQKAWGESVLAGDCSDPDWRKHAVELGSYWVREFGADGFRLDCGGQGQALNWKPRSGHRANAGMLAGGVGQNELLRAAIREINPDAILMPEAGATCHFRAGDLLFDYPFYMVCRELTREPRTDVWVTRARQFLAAQQLTHSPRQVASLVRFLENHDTVAAMDFFGVGPSQALVALSALVPGVLLLYQEQEIGFAPELREWLRLRRELPELRRGDADYESVRCDDPSVLAFLRTTDDAASVVAINFGPRDSACRLDWPDALAQRLPVAQDATTGEGVTRGEPVAIPAYRPRVVTLRREARPVADPPEPAAPAEPLVRGQEEEQVGGGRVRHTIRFAPVTRWLVATGEGLLLDEFVDRSRHVKENETLVEATPTLWRCWRPEEQGLWDGPGPASLGVIAADGRAAEVRITDRSAVRAARIFDPTTLGEQTSVWIETPPGAPPFEVAEHDDADQLIARLRSSPAGPAAARVEVDPLWVRVANEHYSAALARRHGGVLFGLWRAGEERSSLVAPSEVYTDWGLYKKGLHVATEWETNPRLSVAEAEGATTITFRGKLRRPSWNGVHGGYIIEPAIDIRLTYVVDDSPVLRVTVGATPRTERADAEAFLAYRIPFASVRSWRVTGAGADAGGRAGERPGERVYQAHAAGEAMGEVVMRLDGGDGAVAIRRFAGAPDRPQNPFLLDGGGGTMHFFFTLLNGQAVTLPAGEERTASFEIVLR